MRTSAEQCDWVAIFRCYLISALFLILLSAQPNTALSAPLQGAADVKSQRKPYTLPSNLREYLRGRYPQIDDEQIRSTLRATPDGPLGHISLRGRMVPVVEIEEAGAEGRARASALAFIREESELLAIPDIAEVKELGLSVQDDGRTLVDYIQTVGGLELLETHFHFELDGSGIITRVDATLKPVSEELRRAAMRRTLTEQHVIGIVREDLMKGADGQEIDIRPGARKIGVWQPPYVIWGVAASKKGRPPWSYTIDAFTGELLSRKCTARSIGPSRGATPCD